MRDPTPSVKPTIDEIDELVEAMRHHLHEWLEEAAHSEERDRKSEEYTRWLMEAPKRYPRAFGHLKEKTKGLGKRANRGRKSKAHQHRQIAWAVMVLVERFGLAPTRNNQQRGDDWTASRVVQEALFKLGRGMSERTVEGIWDQYRHELDASAV
jgi:hypothetical protein